MDINILYHTWMKNLKPLDALGAERLLEPIQNRMTLNDPMRNFTLNSCPHLLLLAPLYFLHTCNQACLRDSIICNNFIFQKQYFGDK